MLEIFNFMVTFSWEIFFQSMNSLFDVNKLFERDCFVSINQEAENRSCSFAIHTKVMLTSRAINSRVIYYVNWRPRQTQIYAKSRDFIAKASAYGADRSCLPELASRDLFGESYWTIDIDLRHIILKLLLYSFLLQPFRLFYTYILSCANLIWYSFRVMLYPDAKRRDGYKISQITNWTTG